MRNIKTIVVHCSATKETSDYSIEDLKRDHRKRGFTDIGYHKYIRRDGSRHDGRPLSKIGAHVQGFNLNSIGICYEGGLDAYGRPKDTRTEEQKAGLLDIIREILEELKQYQDVSEIKILGHRDFSPDKNKNGKVDSHERIKECPCFDAIPEYSWITA